MRKKLISGKLLLRALLAAACAAVLSRGVGFSADDVSMAFYESWGHYKVEASFFVDADSQTVWDALTDYGHIPQFVHSMKVSKVEGGARGNLVLRQEGEGGFLFFSKRVHLLLDVHETPLQSIFFTDNSHKDFSYYQGNWSIVPATSGHGLEVIYTLDAKQNFSAPAFIANAVVQGNVKDLLQSLHKEIMKRQFLADAEKLKEKTVPVKVAAKVKPAVTSEIR